MDTQRIEWHELEEGQRNCLMWPDFLLWDEPRTVEIQRKDPDASLGLVTTTVQDQETETYYTITICIKENHPAHEGQVNSFEWIFEVDGTTTKNCPSDKFSRICKNGKKVVWLSLKRAVGPMSKFVRKWDAEKIVTLKLGKENDFQKRARLVHFYCQEENGNRKDRILVWEIKPGTDTETSETLHRGDELLAVNGQLVEGKKLAEIYKLILCIVPAEVKLKIKEIQHNICNVEDTTCSKKPTQESKEKTSPGGNEIPNESHEETTPPSIRFSPTSDKICGKCVMNCETQLPDDRDKWPIDKIEHGCFQKMCELIDLSDRSKTPLLSALGCFSNNDADSITQEFTAKGGKGIAKKALGWWGASDRSHNVGALKEILNAMQRVDVVLEIERWENMSVCHGCGIKQSPKQQ